PAVVLMSAVDGAGRVYRRCACRSEETGRQLGGPLPPPDRAWAWPVVFRGDGGGVGRPAGPGAPRRLRHARGRGTGGLGPAAVAGCAGGGADVDGAAVVGVLAVGDRRPATAHDGGQLPLDRPPLPDPVAGRAAVGQAAH